MFRDVIGGHGGCGWAFRGTSVAVDAVVRVDVQHLFAFVKTIARADGNAVGIFATKTRLGHYVSHVNLPFGKIRLH